MSDSQSAGAPARPPVIKDVALAAGVSVPTVSRVLTGSARVSEEKRARVQMAIKALNFRPSAAARALVARQPRLIAVLAGNTSRYGYAETIRGVEECARAAGYTVTITAVESAADEVVDEAVTSVLNQAIAGVVALKFDAPGVAALRKIPASVPTVAVSGVRERGVPQALINESASAEELVTHLLDLGHRTVHHVRVPPSRREDGRTTGWRRALNAHSAPVPQMIDSTWEPRSGREIGRRLASRDDVTAVFCGNDEIAMGVIRGLQDEGRQVPSDISVVGFDDLPLAEIWTPALTTVDQDFADLGARAFGLLEGLLQGSGSRKVSIVRPAVVIRDSAGPPR